jgi:hypothetical protein
VFQHILACIEKEISFLQQHHQKKLLLVAKEFPMELNQDHQMLFYLKLKKKLRSIKSFI